MRPVDADAGEQARRRHDALAKPPGSLGRLEALGAQLAAIAGRCPPPVPLRPALLVACGDHGVHAQGVTHGRAPLDVLASLGGGAAGGRRTSGMTFPSGHGSSPAIVWSGALNERSGPGHRGPPPPPIFTMFCSR